MGCCAARMDRRAARDVLARSASHPSAAWMLAEGADAAALTRSVPLAKALDDALVAYAQNGEMLRPEQGYPLRLLLPGFEGNMNVKWLRRIKRRRPALHDARGNLELHRRCMPDGTARQFTFVMEVKSVITQPSGGEQLAGRAFTRSSASPGPDAGASGGWKSPWTAGTWRDAALQAPVLDKCLTRFRLPWHWEGERRAAEPGHRRDR